MCVFSLWKLAVKRSLDVCIISPYECVYKVCFHISIRLGLDNTKQLYDIFHPIVNFRLKWLCTHAWSGSNIKQGVSDKRAIQLHWNSKIWDQMFVRILMRLNPRVCKNVYLNVSFNKWLRKHRNAGCPKKTPVSQISQSYWIVLVTYHYLNTFYNNRTDCSKMC